MRALFMAWILICASSSTILYARPAVPIPNRDQSATTTVASRPNPEWPLKKTESSPRRDISVEYYGNPDGGGEIWLASPDGKSRRLLCEYSRRIESVLFSPDEQHLIVNNHCLSNLAIADLYDRASALEYKESGLDLTSEVYEFFSRKHPDFKNDFDHSYTDAIAWAATGDAILIRFSGHAAPNNHTDAWFCVYDLINKRPTLDLSVMNRAGTVITPAIPPGRHQSTSGMPDDPPRSPVPRICANP